MRLVGIFGAAAALLASSPSAAANFNFELTGAHTASFSLPSSPIDIDPAGHEAGLDDPTIFAVTTTATIDGSTGLTVLHFYTADGGGGLDVIASVDGDILRFSPAGNSVFRGTIDHPTFVAGEYDFKDWDAPDRSYHLSVTSGAAAVPEPASWALMIGGVGLAGGMIRRRIRKSEQAFTVKVRSIAFNA